MKLLFFPGKSPDLNPIEHCLGFVKRKLERNPTRTLKELRLQVRRIWNNLNDDYLHALCTSMNQRMRVVLKSDGGASKY